MRASSESRRHAREEGARAAGLAGRRRALTTGFSPEAATAGSEMAGLSGTASNRASAGATRSMVDAGSAATAAFSPTGSGPAIGEGCPIGSTAICVTTSFGGRAPSLLHPDEQHPVRRAVDAELCSALRSRPIRFAMPMTALRVTPPRVWAICLDDDPSSHIRLRASLRPSSQLPNQTSSKHRRHAGTAQRLQRRNDPAAKRLHGAERTGPMWDQRPPEAE